MSPSIMSISWDFVGGQTEFILHSCCSQIRLSGLLNLQVKFHFKSSISTERSCSDVVEFLIAQR